MDNENKYKQIFFKFIYWYLQLDKIEENFRKNGVINLDVSGKDMDNGSMFFSLLNEIDISKLTEEEREYLDKININDLTDDTIKFINNTYKRVLLNDDNTFIYYGPMSDYYRVPSDCVSLGFYYDRYGLACGNRLNLEQIRNNEKLIFKTFNYLQFDANSKIKVAFVLYDELYNKIPDRFRK